MRKQSRRVSGVMIAAALTVVATAATARADDRLVARVPFSFVAGDSLLPAGEYTVKAVSDDLSIWAITSSDGRRRSIMFTTVAAPSSPTPTPPELVFDKFENKYFLAKVVTDADDEREIELKPATMEREVIKLAVRNADHVD